MRFPSLHLIISLATGTLLLATSLRAADQPARTPERRAADRAKAITDELKLTREQQEKLRPLLQEEGKKMRAIYQDPKLSRDEKMARLKESRAALRKKLERILTPAQLEKWDKLTARRTQRGARPKN